jgi:hypothetical protein
MFESRLGQLFFSTFIQKRKQEEFHLMKIEIGVIDHCLDLKSRILRIYFPGNDTPTTDKGYKQEILE